jgi:BirA family transcriptional regulator, biotin operon repressor / biotin---[acetyl-CoA-carboxylase] ligase
LRDPILTPFSIVQLDSVPSTNDLVLARIREGSAVAREVYVARVQPEARGRMGRQWTAEEGGLWFTAAMPLYGEHAGWAGMLAALAVCQALDEIGLRAGVKWPNDVVIGRKKLAGVLVEGVAGRELAAVGVGLNVSNPLPATVCPSASGDQPPPAVWPPTSVACEIGREVDPQGLLEPILARFGDLWLRWEAGGLAELQEAWSERDLCRGHEVQLLPKGPTGMADGIELTGALRVHLPGGEIYLARAGELRFVE